MNRTEDKKHNEFLQIHQLVQWHKTTHEIRGY